MTLLTLVFVSKTTHFKYGQFEEFMSCNVFEFVNTRELGLSGSNWLSKVSSLAVLSNDVEESKYNCAYKWVETKKAANDSERGNETSREHLKRG